jgi:hypothetical protein
MRLSLGVVTGVALAAGLGVGVGRAPSGDMLAVRYSDELPNPTHLGDWTTPLEGHAVLIAPNMAEPGTGAGSVTFSVVVTGTGTVCSMSAPCTTGATEYLSAGCPEGTIPAGAQVHLEFSHTCDTSPRGTVTFGFTWAH